MKIGFHASHEQFKPGELIRLVRHAQDAGLQAVLSSDHFTLGAKRSGAEVHISL